MADGSKSGSDSKQDLADERTDWAEDRTVLANERTFAAWMRTGMASVALALGLRAVFGETEYPGAAKIVAELFILTAVMIFFSAMRRGTSTSQRMDTHDAAVQSEKMMRITAAVFSLGAVMTGIILWFL